MPVLTHQEARDLYDRLGSRQDRQGFYEDAAFRDLIAHSGFGEAHAVFEFGSGTARLAEGLLADYLPADSRYVGVDSSSTMVELSRRRLQSWSSRVEVRQSEGDTRFADGDDVYDRFVCNYVLDLLSQEDIRTLLAEAHRILQGRGRLCLISLTSDNTWPSRFISSAWRAVHAIKPQLLGGCRPLHLTGLLSAELWQLEYHHIVRRWAISSEIIVASSVK